MSNPRAIPAIALALLLCAGMAACGQSDAKRSVDARAEALSFYADDAPVVALLRPQPQADVAELNRAATGLPVWEQLREMALEPLHDAGLSRARLQRLTRPSDQIEDVEPAALTLGAATPDDLSGGFPLLVLATDQADLLATYMRRSTAAGAVQKRGTVDEATLYEGQKDAFAVRDGVLISAPSLGLVRSAIARRDGDTDEQLDDDAVESLFSDLEQPGPLLVYADLASVRDADPGLAKLADQAPWTEKLGQTAASVGAEGGRVEIEDFSKSTDELSSGELPIGAEPTPFDITAQSVAVLIDPGPVQSLLSGLAPISGEATASSDEVRLRVTVGG